MKKRVLILVSLLLMASVPLSIHAENETAVHSEEIQTYSEQSEIVYLNGQTGNDSNDGSTAEKAVRRLDKALELAGNNGIIYINGFIDLGNKGEVTIENAHIVRADGYKGRLFYVSQNTQLTLNNVVMDGNKENVSGNVSELINVTNGASLTINEGTRLINNDYTALKVEDNGGNPASVIMNGGEISGNDGKSAYPGGVLVSGNFTMNDGTINNNTAFYDGAGVGILRHKFVMNGGSIEENAAPNGCGAGLYANSKNAAAELLGGQIKNNTALFGAGIAVLDGAHVLLNGADVIGNESEYNGAGVYLEAWNTETEFIMQSGSIIDNVSAEGNGGGIFAYSNENTSGSTVTIAGGTIAGNEATATESGTAIALKMNMSALSLEGSPVIDGDVFLINKDDEYLNVTASDFTPTKPVLLSANSTLQSGHQIVILTDTSADAFTLWKKRYAMNDEGKILLLTAISFKENEEDDGTVIYVHPEAAVNQEDIPAFSKTGYELSGFKKENNEDFDLNTAVGENDFVLYPSWTLKAPSLSLTADKTTVLKGGSVTLSALAEHDLDAEYTYQWYKNNMDEGYAIPGAVSNQYVVDPLTETTTYYCIVTAVFNNESQSANEHIKINVTQPTTSSPSPISGSEDSIVLTVTGQTVSDSQIRNAVKKAEENSVITIKAEGKNDLEFSSNGLKLLTENGHTLKIELQNGEATLDTEMINNLISDIEASIKVSIEESDLSGNYPLYSNAYEIQILADDKDVHSFKGNLRIEFFNLDVTDPYVIHIKNDGVHEVLIPIFKDKKLIIEDLHNISTFVIVDASEAEHGWYSLGNEDWGYNDETGHPVAYSWIASYTDWYFIQNGVMMRNYWLAADNGRWYYLDHDGKMVKNQLVDGCWINSYGVYMSPLYYQE